MSLWGTKKVEVELLEPETLPKQELRRRAILLSTPKTEVEKLAEEAVRVLNYNVLAEHIGMGGKLTQVLRTLQIPILNTDEVERYKRYMGEKVQASLGGGHRYVAQWRTLRIEYYKEPIPEFVLRKAVDIKKRIPEVCLNVDFLEIGFKSADPFLQARFGTEDYYIEVWDEPEFEVKL
jgi:hypothetical protein